MAPMTEKSVQASPATGVEHPVAEVTVTAHKEVMAVQPQPVMKSNKGKLRKAVSLQDSPEAAAKALEAAGATPGKGSGEFVSCYRTSGTLSVPTRKLSLGGGVLPPMPGAPVVSANTVQDELKRAFRRGLGASRAVARFKKPVRDKQQLQQESSNNNVQTERLDEKQVGKVSETGVQGNPNVESKLEELPSKGQVSLDKNGAANELSDTSNNDSSGLPEDTEAPTKKEVIGKPQNDAQYPEKQQQLHPHHQTKRARPLRKQFSLQIEPSCEKIATKDATINQFPNAKSEKIQEVQQATVDAGSFAEQEKSGSMDSTSTTVKATSQCNTQVHNQQQTNEIDAVVVNNAVHMPVETENSSCNNTKSPISTCKTDTSNNINDNNDTLDRRPLGDDDHSTTQQTSRQNIDINAKVDKREMRQIQTPHDYGEDKSTYKETPLPQATELFNRSVTGIAFDDTQDISEEVRNIGRGNPDFPEIHNTTAHNTTVSDKQIPKTPKKNINSTVLVPKSRGKKDIKQHKLEPKSPTSDKDLPASSGQHPTFNTVVDSPQANNENVIVPSNSKDTTKINNFDKMNKKTCDEKESFQNSNDVRKQSGTTCDAGEKSDKERDVNKQVANNNNSKSASNQRNNNNSSNGNKSSIRVKRKSASPLLVVIEEEGDHVMHKNEKDDHAEGEENNGSQEDMQSEMIRNRLSSEESHQLGRKQDKERTEIENNRDKKATSLNSAHSSGAAKRDGKETFSPPSPPSKSTEVQRTVKDATSNTDKKAPNKKDNLNLKLLGPAKEEALACDNRSAVWGAPVWKRADDLPRLPSISAMSKAALPITERTDTHIITHGTKPVIHLCMPADDESDVVPRRKSSTGSSSSSSSRDSLRRSSFLMKAERNSFDDDDDEVSKRIREDYAWVPSRRGKGGGKCSKHDTCHCYLFSLDTVGFYALS